MHKETLNKMKDETVHCHQIDILIADDMAHERRAIEFGLRKKLDSKLSLRIQMAECAEDAIVAIRTHSFDIVIFDIDFSESPRSKGMTGLQGAKLAKSIRPGLSTVIVSSHETREMMCEAIERYEVDRYLRRSSISYSELSLLCQRALLSKLHKEGDLGEKEHQICSLSKKMQRTLKTADEITSDQNILIVGETGTGKELLAHRIHQNAKFLDSEPERPLIVLDCSTLSENLFEAEVFGYKKGAFTGAEKNKVGLLELADGGDLFLDEVQNMPIKMQKTLLRAMNSGTYKRIGDNNPRKSKFRVIAAMNQDPEQCKKDGRILPDFLARIERIRVTVPPLRDRKEDIPILVSHFLHSSETNLDKEFTSDAFLELSKHHWTENIRELKSVVESCVLRSRIPLVEGQTVKEVIQSRKPSINQQVTEEKIEVTEEDLLKEVVLRSLEKSVSLAEMVNSLETLYFKKLTKTSRKEKYLVDHTGYSRTKVRKRLESLEV